MCIDIYLIFLINILVIISAVGSIHVQLYMYMYGVQMYNPLSLSLIGLSRVSTFFV